jgi:hypothetical protein
MRSQRKRHSNGSSESSFWSVKMLNNSLSYWVGWRNILWVCWGSKLQKQAQPTVEKSKIGSKIRVATVKHISSLDTSAQPHFVYNSEHIAHSIRQGSINIQPHHYLYGYIYAHHTLVSSLILPSLFCYHN